MSRRGISAAWVSAILGSVLLASISVADQRHELRASPPDRPGDRYGGPSSRGVMHEVYEPPASLAPAFVGPLTRGTDGNHMGIAGWTVPAPTGNSRAAADPGDTGWLGFGFAAEWGQKARPRRN
jgi:hypothetical protein